MKRCGVRLPKRLVPPIAADGIRLRPLQESDLPLTRGWRNEPDIRKWFFHSDLISEEQHLAWWQAYCERDDDYMFVIEETRHLHRPVGQVGVYNVDWLAGTGEFGRLLVGDAQARGQGLAKKAVQALVAAMTGMGVSVLRLEVMESNQSAREVYRATGFTESGITEGVVMMERRGPDVPAPASR